MRCPGQTVAVALGIVLGALFGGAFGFALGTTEPLPVPHAWEDSVRAVRFDVDVLEGRTAAGLEMCGRAPETALRALLGGGDARRDW